MKKLIKNIASNKTTKDDAFNSLKEDSDTMIEIRQLKRSGNRPTMINLYNDFMQIFGPDYTDKVDNKTNDNEQSDTTDMSDIESEESPEQRRNQKGQRLKLLTANQMLSRLPISLAQLEAGNNSEKLKK